MCGILFTNRYSVSWKAFRGALQLLSRRGPDAIGLMEPWEGAKLGHTRLAVIDPGPSSDQPYITASKRGVIAFNGEIYNFREIAEIYGFKEQRHSDTAVLAELIESRGLGSLTELNGMFAFVFLDITTKSVHLGRDRLGIKPLFVYHDEQGVIVSSEIAPIVALTGPLEWDELAVRQYVSMRGFFGGSTLYKGIEMFPPAHYETGGQRYRYWTLEPHDASQPSLEEIEDLITSAVHLRLVSDVPVGSFLSGGVDSSLIAALARVGQAFTVGVPEDNELAEARATADALGMKHHYQQVGNSDFFARLEAMVRDRQEPLSVPNEVLLDALSETASGRVKVLLSGEGADELFAGYHRIFDWAASVDEFDIRDFASLYCYGTSYDLPVIENALEPFLDFQSPYLIVSAFFQQAHLHGLLRRLDFATMHHGIEARVPFVDHRLVERMFGIRHAFKRAPDATKYPLRTIALKHVPSSVAYRVKKGFPVPLQQMLPTTELKPFDTPYDYWFAFNLRVLRSLR